MGDPLAPTTPMRLATLAAVVTAVLTAAAAAQPQTVLYPGSAGRPLLDAVRADYAPAATLGYDRARDSLYAYGQRAEGALCGVYTRFCVRLTPGADPSSDAFAKGINAEHTWPQSQGAGAEPLRSDLHHLFPARIDVNAVRGSDPFGEVPDAEADGWYRGAERRTARPVVFVDEWSEADDRHPDPAWGGRFEPRHDHKGNVARAVFYVRAVHAAAVAGAQPFFDVMADDLIAWHDADPVDPAEYARSAWIARLQGTPNPFVLDPTLARRAFGRPGGGPGAPGGTLWVNEVHYDNAGADAGEGVEVAGPSGASLAGWTLVLYNGSGGAPYRTVALAGTVPDQQGGWGAVWVPAAGLQNGAPDGLALVDPAGAVVELLSYEGTFTATAGPAAGRTSVDVGVSETSSTPVGTSLQRTDTGTASAAWAAARPASRGVLNAGQAPAALRASASRVAGVEATVYPNPTLGPTTVVVRLAEPAAVTAEVFDALGRRVAVAEAGPRGAGSQAVDLDLSVPAGAYVVRITAGPSVVVRSLTVVR